MNVNHTHTTLYALTHPYVVIRPVLELNKTRWPYIIPAKPRKEPGCLCTAHGFRGFGLGLACGIVSLLRGWHPRENDRAMQDQALLPWNRNPLPLDTGRSASVASKLFSMRSCLRMLSPLSQGLVFQLRNLFSPIPLIVTCVSDFIQVAAQPD